MASICEIVEESTNACLKWVEYTPVIDQLAITRDQALIIITPIFSIYVLLIGWSIILLIYHQSK